MNESKEEEEAGEMIIMTEEAEEVEAEAEEIVSMEVVSISKKFKKKRVPLGEITNILSTFGTSTTDADQKKKAASKANMQGVENSTNAKENTFCEKKERCVDVWNDENSFYFYEDTIHPNLQDEKEEF